MSKQTTQLHETLHRDEVIEGSTDRAFGLTVGGILGAIAAWRYFAVGWSTVTMTLVAIAVPLVALGAVAPSLLAPLNRAWTRLGLVMFKVVNPVVMLLLYAISIVPIGLVMRAVGHDPLRRSFDRGAGSYWIRRDPPGPAPDTMNRQF